MGPKSDWSATVGRNRPVCHIDYCVHGYTRSHNVISTIVAAFDATKHHFATFSNPSYYNGNQCDAFNGGDARDGGGPRGVCTPLADNGDESGGDAAIERRLCAVTDATTADNAANRVARCFTRPRCQSLVYFDRHLLLRPL